MTPQKLDSKFQQLQQQLPTQTEDLARKHGAFKRARRVKTAFELLRAALLYSLCDLSLREVAGWFTGRGQRMTDESVRERLNSCSRWLLALIGEMLPAVKLPPAPDGKKSWRLVICDGSVVNGPGSKGADYRLHLSFDPFEQKIDQLHVYDGKMGESLKLFHQDQSVIEMGDRGYAKAPGLIATRKHGAHFIVRMSPNYLALRDLDGNRFDVSQHLREAGDADDLSFEVLVQEAKTRETCQAYLHARRLSEQEANKARRRARKKARRNGDTVRELTLSLCDWLFILTSVPPDELPAGVIFELYRVRWQIELLIKRFKSLLNVDCLRAMAGSPLAEVYLSGNFLFALLVESATLKRVGNDWVRMTGSREMTCWRIWKLIAAEIKEAVLNTIAWDRLDWREMLNVLGERKRKRKLQIIPDAVVHWLRGKPILASP
jgi:hypothetical protein